MEIKLNRQPLGVVKLDLIKFEIDMKKHLDIERAVKENSEVVNKQDMVDEDVLITKAFEETDWGQILKLYNVNEECDREMSMQMVVWTGNIIDQPRFIPDQRDQDNMSWTFKKGFMEGMGEEAEFISGKYSGEILFVTNTFNKYELHHFDRFIGLSTLDWSDGEMYEEFKQVLDLDKAFDNGC